MKVDPVPFMIRYWNETNPAKRAIIRDQYRWLVEIVAALYAV